MGQHAGCSGVCRSKAFASPTSTFSKKNLSLALSRSKKHYFGYGIPKNTENMNLFWYKYIKAYDSNNTEIPCASSTQSKRGDVGRKVPLNMETKGKAVSILQVPTVVFIQTALHKEATERAKLSALHWPCTFSDCESS